MTHHVFTPYAGLLYGCYDNYTAYASYTDIFPPQTYCDSNGSYPDPKQGRSYELRLLIGLLWCVTKDLADDQVFVLSTSPGIAPGLML